MKKHKNFIDRLLRRNNASGCEELNIAKTDEQSAEEVEAVDQVIILISDETADQADSGVPTICKGGRRYHARLRNGRWETIGAPIGDC